MILASRETLRPFRKGEREIPAAGTHQQRLSMSGVIDKALIFRVRDRIAIYTESAGLRVSPDFAIVPTV